MSFRNSNPAPLPVFSRTNSSAVFEQSNSNEMLLREIRLLNNKIDYLQQSQEQLINVLSPLFPRIDNSQSSNELISEAAVNGKYTII